MTATNKKIFLLVIFGLPLTGKTTLAKELQRSLNLPFLDVDFIREGIDKVRQKNPKIRFLSPGKELKIIISSYTLMCRKALQKITKEKSSIAIAGSFSRKIFKKPLFKLVLKLKQKNIPIKAVFLTCPYKEIKKRILKRKREKDKSNIDSLEKFKWVENHFKPIDFLPNLEISSVKTDYFFEIIKYLKD